MTREPLCSVLSGSVSTVVRSNPERDKIGRIGRYYCLYCPYYQRKADYYLDYYWLIGLRCIISSRITFPTFLSMCFINVSIFLSDSLVTFLFPRAVLTNVVNAPWQNISARDQQRNFESGPISSNHRGPRPESDVQYMPIGQKVFQITRLGWTIAFAIILPSSRT